MGSQRIRLLFTEDYFSAHDLHYVAKKLLKHKESLSIYTTEFRTYRPLFFNKLVRDEFNQLLFILEELDELMVRRERGEMIERGESYKAYGLAIRGVEILQEFEAQSIKIGIRDMYAEGFRLKTESPYWEMAGYEGLERSAEAEAYLEGEVKELEALFRELKHFLEKNTLMQLATPHRFRQHAVAMLKGMEVVLSAITPPKEALEEHIRGQQFPGVGTGDVLIEGKEEFLAPLLELLDARKAGYAMLQLSDFY